MSESIRRMWQEVMDSWRRFGWRGISVINFCPGCMKLIFTKEEARFIGTAFMSRDFDAIVQLIRSISIPGLALFVPGDKRTAQSLDHRVVIYSLCRECLPNAEKEEFLRRIERNIILERRLGEVVKL